MQARLRAHAGRAALGCVIAALASAGAARAALRWTIDRTPTPPGAPDSALAGVSCPSATACVAVGHFTSAGGNGEALVERSNGARWSIARPARPSGAITTLLFDVSCPTSTMCMAAGSVTNRAGRTVPLVEQWNGSTWRVGQPVAPRAFRGAISYLGGISCATSMNCTAVGYVGDGTGTRGAALVERWDGTRWRIGQTPRVGGAIAAFLSGVSCPARQSCTAVGFANGTTGASLPLAERWNGSSWTVQRAPRPSAATAVRLAGISCASARSCTAVGSFTIVTGIEIMLGERWDGHHWTIERTRYPAGARAVQLSAVSCPALWSCTAVGSFNDVAGIDVTLAESRRGAAWTIERPPDPTGSTGASLVGVACSAPDVCVAVGSATGPDGTTAALAERSSRSDRAASIRARRPHGTARFSPPAVGRPAETENPSRAIPPETSRGDHLVSHPQAGCPVRACILLPAAGIVNGGAERARGWSGL